MIRKISTFILALISTIGINLKLDKNLNFIESLTGNEITYIFIFFAFIILIDKALNNKDKRLTIISIILSLLFGIFEILGHTIVNYGDFSGILLNGSVKFKNIFKFMSYVIISYSAINVLFNTMAKNTEKENKKDIKIFTNNKLSIFTVAFVLLILWIPYFLRHFPGILGIDACNQLEQATGIIPLSSHHPIFITLLIKLIITITMPIFNNMTISVAIIILLKMIIMAFGMSIAIYYLAKKNISAKIRLLILTFFAINPVVPLYGVSLDKDSLFAIILLIDMLLLFEFVTNTEKFIKSKLKIILTSVCIILTVLIRNNGLYIFILTIPFIYVFLRKNYIKLTTFFAITIIAICLINTLIFNVFNIKKGSVVEMLSIPMQAMARLTKYNDNNLTDEEKQEINLFMKYDKLAQSYNPNLSDPIKGLFREEYFNEHKLQYIAVNAKLLIKYPTYYIESILCNTSGYWYPENRKLMFERGVVENKFNIEGKSLIPNNVIHEELDWGPEKREIPVVGMLFSSGFCFWIFLIIIFYTIYRKRYDILLVQLPFIINYLIVIAGPSNTEFRYMLPLYIALPVLFSLTIKELKDKGEEEK